MPPSTKNIYKETRPLASQQILFDEQYCWDRFRMGDEEAFTRIATHYYRNLVHYGLKFTQDKQMVEDALQDLLIHLWLHRANIMPTPSVKFYLMKAFRHQLFKNLKRPHKGQSIDWLNENLANDCSVEDELIQIEEEKEIQAKFNTLLNALPARQREVLYLRYYQALTTEEIAQLLGIKAQSVSNIVQRSLAKLREYWLNSLLLFLLPELTATLLNFQA